MPPATYRGGRDTMTTDQTASDGDQQTPPSATAAETLRARLVDQLRESGVLRDAAVERAMRDVPRHLFLPASSLAEAYADAAVATHWEDDIAVSSASQPAIVALMLEQLRVAPGMRVLEIGAGTGYNAALLAALVGPTGSVTSVDLDPVIVAEARAHLGAAEVANVAVHAGDGRDGWPDGAPYDRMLLTVGADDIWPSWRTQLAEGGLVVLPLELANGQASVAFRRRGDLLSSESITPCGFMRLRGDAASASLVALADGRRLLGERAGEIAERVAALLRTRPRVHVGRRLDAGTLQRLGFHLASRDGEHAGAGAASDTAQAANARLVTLFPRGFNGRGRRIRHGVYAIGAGVPSLALYGSVLPFLFVFGGDAAERVIEAALADGARSYLPIERWRIEARPPSVASPTIPPGALRLARAHCIFDLWPFGESAFADSST
jgi:protein-L-isoaspartate(D-aspartate) O-methyltransferase